MELVKCSTSSPKSLANRNTHWARHERDVVKSVDEQDRTHAAVAVVLLRGDPLRAVLQYWVRCHCVPGDSCCTSCRSR